VIGLASSVLWNQLMLCVTVLTGLFGKPALARAATAQNALCALAMVLLTFGQRLVPQMDVRSRLTLCAASFVVMLGLGMALASMLHDADAPEHIFLTLVALNGLCTGMAQNLAASLSTMFEGASGALLFGESMSPLVAVAIAACAESLGQVASLTLLLAEGFVLGALLAIAWVARAKAAAPSASSAGQCLCEGGEAREYVLHRFSQLLGNTAVAFFACCIWVFLLCSSPFISEGLCRGSACSNLPSRMISVANVAATLGRFLGLKVNGRSWLPALVLESLMLLGFGMLVIFASAFAELPAMSFQAALAVALCISGGLTLWSNFLLMRNDHSAQSTCGHSVLLPCHVTTEIMWLSIQVGSITGTRFAAAL